jgi:hypothetical protein
MHLKVTVRIDRISVLTGLHKVSKSNRDEEPSDEITIVIACGTGQQSLKWLALVATSRHSQTFPEYSRRFLLPISVTKLKSPTDICFSPSDKICSHFGDSDDALVLLSNGYTLNDCGRPIVSRWAILAFDLSEKQSCRRLQAAEIEKRLSWEREIAQQQEKRHEREARIMQKAAIMRTTLRSKLDVDSAVVVAFSEDWDIMNQIKGFIDICCGPIARHEVEAALLPLFPALNELYKTYSASTGVGTSDLELSEFAAFVYDCAVFKLEAHTAEVISAIFRSSCGSKSQTVMQRPHFLTRFVYQ